jgi:hypothetical protein
MKSGARLPHRWARAHAAGRALSIDALINESSAAEYWRQRLQIPVYHAQPF